LEYWIDGILEFTSPGIYAWDYGQKIIGILGDSSPNNSQVAGMIIFTAG